MGDRWTRRAGFLIGFWDSFRWSRVGSGVERGRLGRERNGSGW